MSVEARVLALAESPAQLLNVAEWAHATRTRNVEVYVVAPAGAQARLQLHNVSTLTQDVLGPIRWVEARLGAASLLRALGRLAGPVQRAGTVVLGDPFSRFAQTLLSLTSGGRVVVVDDGTATVEFVELMAQGRPLLRWHRGEVAESDRLLAWQAGRRLRAAELSVFSAMPLPPHPGGPARQANHYRWLRHRFATPELLAGAALVGTSLVETGVVSDEAYLGGLRSLVAERGLRRYYAHRREASAKLAAVADLGLTVLRPELPLEIEFARGPVHAEVLSFPSTVLHTLPVVLSGSGARVEALPIDRGWLTARSVADDRARRFLDSVGHGGEGASPARADVG